MEIFVTAVFAICTFIPSIYCAGNTVAWCYHLSTCNDAKWPEIAPQFCNGSRQSPINIATSAVKPDSKLTAFTFENFHRKSVLKTITNTGKTVKVNFRSGVKVKGGDLPEEYDSLQFHLHWGNGASVPGSEHTVDGKRYPMELHIVNIKSSYNGNTTLGVADSMGLAALGFFIEEMSSNVSGQPASWKKLTSYLSRISNKDDSVSMDQDISLDDLLDGVNRTKYFRYLGSLTTPNCNEAVVWTVFKETIKVSKDLINLFSTTLHTSDSASPIMIDVYRNIQPDQKVTTQPGNNSNSLSTNYYSLAVLLALNLMQFMNW